LATGEELVSSLGSVLAAVPVEGKVKQDGLEAMELEDSDVD
jgi:hypothetical protein